MTNEKEKVPPIIPYEEWEPYKKHIKMLEDIVSSNRALYSHSKRSNPTLEDITVYDFDEVIIPSGDKAVITFTVPSGYVFYFPKCGMTYYPNSRYKLYIDGILIYDTPFDIQGISSHNRIFEPPEIVKANVTFEIINGDASQHIYWLYISGWLRRREAVEW